MSAFADAAQKKVRPRRTTVCALFSGLLGDRFLSLSFHDVRPDETNGDTVLVVLFDRLPCYWVIGTAFCCLLHRLDEPGLQDNCFSECSVVSFRCVRAPVDVWELGDDGLALCVAQPWTSEAHDRLEDIKLFYFEYLVETLAVHYQRDFFQCIHAFRPVVKLPDRVIETGFMNPPPEFIFIFRTLQASDHVVSIERHFEEGLLRDRMYTWQ